MPFFPPIHQNMELVERMQVVAERKGVAASQLALAWVMAQGPDVVPIPGARLAVRGYHL